MKNPHPSSGESAKHGQGSKLVRTRFCHSGSLDGGGDNVFLVSSIVGALAGGQKSTIPTIEERLKEANRVIEM